MAAKPNPALGLVLGIIAGYAGVVGASYAGAKVQIVRQVRFDSIDKHGVLWLAVLLLIAAVLGLLMAGRTIGAGVMVGAGTLMALAGLAVQVAPIRQVSDLLTLFQVPGSKIPPYLLMDGSVLLLGVVLLIAGIGRWISDARVARLQGPGQLQDTGGYPPMFPGQQPQQWGGYPGQQQQPPHPGQPQQQQYPGQQPPR